MCLGWVREHRREGLLFWWNGIWSGKPWRASWILPALMYVLGLSGLSGFGMFCGEIKDLDARCGTSRTRRDIDRGCTCSLGSGAVIVE